MEKQKIYFAQNRSVDKFTVGGLMDILILEDNHLCVRNATSMIMPRSAVLISVKYDLVFNYVRIGTVTICYIESKIWHLT